MFLALPVLFNPFFLFDLEIVVGAVVIECPVIPFTEERAVVIGFGLYEVAFFRQDTEGTINIMTLIGRRFQIFLCLFVRRGLAFGTEYPGIYKI